MLDDIRGVLDKTKKGFEHRSNGYDEPVQQREESPDVWCLDSPMTPDNVYAEVLTLKTMSKFDGLFEELGKRSKGI